MWCPRAHFFPWLALSVTWPQLLSLFILQKTLGPAAARVPPQRATLTTATLGIVLMSGLTLMFMLPNRYDFSTGPVYDTDYYVSRIGFVVFTVPAMIYYGVALLQGTKLYERGLLHEGTFWAWPDFQSYEWDAARPNALQTLTLRFKKSWLAKTLKIANMSVALRPSIEAVLARHISNN